MRKIMIVVFIVILCFLLSIVCSASGDDMEQEQTQTGGQTSTLQEDDEVDIKVYLQERIVPVVVGALTAVLAFLATIGTVSRSLKSLKDTKDAFSDEAKERTIFFESGIALLAGIAEELKEAVEGVPELKSKIEELSEKEELLAEILSLGFSANSEIIKSGKGKKMAMLIENAKRKVQNAELAVGASPHPTSEVGLPEKEVIANETI